MNKIVDARCAMFNIMQVHDQADLSVLGSFRKLLDERVPDLYVDISWVSILSFLENYSTYVIKQDDTLRRTSKYGKFADRKFLDETINKNFSEEIRQAIKEASELSDPGPYLEESESDKNVRILTELLLDAAKDLGKNRVIDKEIWKEMLERQKLSERSLKSNIKMSGTLE